MSYIKELHRYPVKSLLGERLTTTPVGANGFPGDRVWAVRHNGATLTGKKFPALMSARATLINEPDEKPGNPRCSTPATITLPNGNSRDTADSSINQWLGEYLNHPAELWPLVDPADLEFYRRQASSASTPAEIDAEFRAVFSRLPDEPLPDIASFPAEVLEYDTPPGTYFDAYPLLLMSTQSLATLAANSPNAQQNFDQRRFRPNIVLDGFAADGQTNGFPENALVGKECRIGEVVLAVELPCPRCIMTTHPVADVPKDPGIMRQLVQQNGGNLGVYARIITGGVISEGDSLEVINA